MNLQIRNPRAHELARKLAAARKTSITDAVIEALEAELARESERRPLPERLAAIARALREKGTKGGRDLEKDEVDRMWGHP